MQRFDEFISCVIANTPEFMIVENENEKYIILDRFVTEIDKNAMTWLFKVYLEQNYKILKDDKLDSKFKEKYPNLNLKMINEDGNLFLNKDAMIAILEELYNQNQIEFDFETNQINML